jgi:hypothetical protein
MMKPFLSIVGISVIAAVIYGIIHDQITARICVEYFTIGHPRLIDSDSPTVLGLFWGVVATWWVGLPMGIGLAIAARRGKRPMLAPSDLVVPLGGLLLGMFIIAAIGGMIGYITATNGIFVLVKRLAVRIPPERHVAFLVCGWAHGASYLSGLIGGIALWVLTWRRRGRMAPDMAKD